MAPRLAEDLKHHIIHRHVEYGLNADQGEGQLCTMSVD